MLHIIRSVDGHYNWDPIFHSSKVFSIIKYLLPKWCFRHCCIRSCIRSWICPWIDCIWLFFLWHFSVSQISGDQARKALLKEVSKHCCYGKGAVSSMEITKVSPSNAMHVGWKSPSYQFTIESTSNWYFVVVFSFFLLLNLIPLTFQYLCGRF